MPSSILHARSLTQSSINQPHGFGLRHPSEKTWAETLPAGRCFQFVQNSSERRWRLGANRKNTDTKSLKPCDKTNGATPSPTSTHTPTATTTTTAGTTTTITTTTTGTATTASTTHARTPTPIATPISTLIFLLILLLLLRVLQLLLLLRLVLQ